METQKHIEMLNAVADVVNRREPSAHQPALDSLGIACPVEYPGRYFLHGKRGTIYRVIDYCMRGDDDVWHIEYVNINPQISTVKYVRTVTNFTGNLENGHRRFVEIHDVAMIGGDPAARLPAAAMPDAELGRFEMVDEIRAKVVEETAAKRDAILKTIPRPTISVQREGKRED